MSWFARSIANTLNLNDDQEEDSDHDHNDTNKSLEEKKLIDSPSSPSSPGRGVKDDLSELTQTLTRQFWGVASFLAPPPPPDPPHISQSEPSEGISDPEGSDPEAISGIRSDLAEIGGKFRTGISNLSKNIDVSEITKLASNFLQLGEDEEEDYDSLRGVVGITDDVVAFVRDIAMHPGTWLDFPLPEDEDEDFAMTDAQQEHALAVERLATRLAALRIELCPDYMSEHRFWMIYFVLLHPRLDVHDAELLSTPHIMEARASLTQELKNRTNAKPEEDLSNTGTNTSYSKDITESPHEEPLSVRPPIAKSKPVEPDLETDKHPILSTNIQIIDKSVIQEGPVNQKNDQNSLSRSSSKAIEIKGEEDDGDDWLKEENPETGGASGPTVLIDNDEDVSFSDLEDEDEDDGNVPTSYKRVTHCSDSSTRGSADWVQLSRSSDDSVPIECSGSEQVSTRNLDNKESNDWLDVDDIDVA